MLSGSKWMLSGCFSFPPAPLLRATCHPAHWQAQACPRLAAGPQGPQQAGGAGPPGGGPSGGEGTEAAASLCTPHAGGRKESPAHPPCRATAHTRPAGPHLRTPACCRTGRPGREVGPEETWGGASAAGLGWDSQVNQRWQPGARVPLVTGSWTRAQGWRGAIPEQIFFLMWF